MHSTRSLDAGIDRLRGLTPDTMRRWGSLTPHAMMCHLADSSRMALGERPQPLRAAWPRRTVMRLVALHTPITFPRGFKTLPALDPSLDGTKPTSFDEDRAQLIALIERIRDSAPTIEGNSHPLFGPLTGREWITCVSKHTDHHLRQFGL